MPNIKGQSDINESVQIRTRYPSSLPCYATMPEAPSPVSAVYEPKPTLKYASVVGLQAGTVGLFVSAIQNALGTHSHGALGFVTRTGGTIGFFGMLLQFSRYNSALLHSMG